MNRYLWMGFGILALSGTMFGWYRSELERARQQGIAEQMASQAHQIRIEFDSAVAANEAAKRATAVRLARLSHDSTVNAQERQLLANAASSASHRADSILTALMDSLPQLAGVRAAMDTLQRQVASERDGRILAERARAEAEAGKAAAEELLAAAGKVIASQATTIEQLQKAGSRGGGALGAILTLLIAGGSFALGAAAF